MHDMARVRELHRIADIQKQLYSFFQFYTFFAAIVEQRQALDILHREIGPAVGGDAAVEQVSDMRMLQARQNLALAQEAREYGVGVHAALDQLERRALPELAVRALGQPDDAHAARADLAHESPRPDAAVDLRGS